MNYPKDWVTGRYCLYQANTDTPHNFLQMSRKTAREWNKRLVEHGDFVIWVLEDALPPSMPRVDRWNFQRFVWDVVALAEQGLPVFYGMVEPSDT